MRLESSILFYVERRVCTKSVAKFFRWTGNGLNSSSRPSLAEQVNTIKFRAIQVTLCGMLMEEVSIYVFIKRC